jgi:hypothetical protein
MKSEGLAPGKLNALLATMAKSERMPHRQALTTLPRKSCIRTFFLRPQGAMADARIREIEK